MHDDPGIILVILVMLFFAALLAGCLSDDL